VQAFSIKNSSKREKGNKTKNVKLTEKEHVPFI